MIVIAIVAATVVNSLIVFWALAAITDRINQVEHELHERINTVMRLLK